MAPTSFKLGRFRYLQAEAKVPAAGSLLRQVHALDLSDIKELVEDMRQGPTPSMEKTRQTLKTKQEPVPAGEKAVEPEAIEELKEHVGPDQETPPDEELDTVEERQTQIEQVLQEKDLPEKIQGLVKESTRLLNTNGVKSATGAKEFYIEGDGVDIVFDLDPANLKNAEVIFDWTIQGTWDKLFRFLEDKTALDTKHDLREVILEYCGQTYVAHDPAQAKNLLLAIATLQKVDTRPRDYMPKPDKRDKAELQDWALEIARQVLSRHPTIRLESPNVVIKQVQDDEKDGNFEEGTATDFAKFVKDQESGGWQNLIKDNLQVLKSDRVIKPSKKELARAIMELTDNRYKGQLITQYADDGSLLVTLKAPFPLMVRFERKAGKVQFQELVTAICDLVFVTDDSSLAKDLLKANINLGVAAGEAVEENFSPERKEQPAKSVDDAAQDVAEELAQDKDIASFLKELRAPKKLKELTPEEMEERTTRFSKIFDSPERTKEFLDWVADNSKAAGRFFSENDDLLLWLQSNQKEIFADISSLIITG